MIEALSKFPVQSDRIECSLLVEDDLDWYIGMLEQDYISEFLEFRKPDKDGWQDELRKLLLFNNELIRTMGIADIRSVIKLHDGTRVGSMAIIGLTDSPAYRGAELAYWMDKRYSGNGYCKEAIYAITSTFNQYTFYARIDSRNYKSINLIKSCGFKKKSTKISNINNEKIIVFCNKI